ncbi:hypothetical protein E2C01_001282 [Portunus trituberculatus]|uniref:Uncharacterized protein n=1 Tax=Portunus trituberculatus TaxID=210409 RepID=A0A5B7CGX1_PORTR|nr:hypothetical protein [Portunus trituberculatus]
MSFPCNFNKSPWKVIEVRLEVFQNMALIVKNVYSNLSKSPLLSATFSLVLDFQSPAEFYLNEEDNLNCPGSVWCSYREKRNTKTAVARVVRRKERKPALERQREGGKQPTKRTEGSPEQLLGNYH